MPNDIPVENEIVAKDCDSMSMKDIDVLLDIFMKRTQSISIIYQHIEDWKDKSFAIGVDSDEGTDDELLINMLRMDSWCSDGVWRGNAPFNSVMLSEFVDLRQFTDKIIPIDSEVYVKLMEQLELMNDLENL